MENRVKLDQWIAEEIAAGRATGRKDAYRRLSESIKAKGGETVSALTIESAAGGMRIKKYPKAKAISEATGTPPMVTIAELCE
jgi:hypothetical protein